MKKKVTKENVRKWFEDHKAELAIIGINAVAFVWSCTKIYSAGYKKGVDDCGIESIRVIHDPTQVKNGNRLPLEVKMKSGAKVGSISGCREVSEDIINLIKDADKL